MQSEDSKNIGAAEELPLDLALPPEPPAGLKVYQDERGEVLSSPRQSRVGAVFLCVWLVFWWIGIAKQLHALLTTSQGPTGWFFFAIFCIPGVVVPFVVLGMLFGAQELSFKYDGEVLCCRRFGFLRFAKKSFYPKDVQRISVRQALAYTKNHDRVNHPTSTSMLEIALSENTLRLMFPNDPDQAIARFCGARLRAEQRTF